MFCLCCFYPIKTTGWPEGPLQLEGPGLGQWALLQGSLLVTYRKHWDVSSARIGKRIPHEAANGRLWSQKDTLKWLVINKSITGQRQPGGAINTSSAGKRHFILGLAMKTGLALSRIHSTARCSFLHFSRTEPDGKYGKQQTDPGYRAGHLSPQEKIRQYSWQDAHNEKNWLSKSN